MSARAVLEQWAAEIARLDLPARQTQARARLEAIDKTHTLLLCGNRAAIRDLQAAGLAASDIPVIKGWLATVAATGTAP